MRIALCGEARSGKDTVAHILQDLHVGATNDQMWRLAFGDYMKEGYYRDNPHMVGLPKDREHMIEWSQPQVSKDNLIWVRKLESEMSEIIFHDAIFDFVITDLRQPHEEKWCRENGFHIVRVHASTATMLKRRLALGEKLSEKDLTYHVDADFHIYNDGSLKDLEINTQKLLQVLESYDKIKTVTNEVNTRK